MDGTLDGKFYFEEGLFNHETVFIGYRENKSAPDGVEYLVRDHDGKTATWGWMVENCDITVLEMR